MIPLTMSLKTDMNHICLCSSVERASPSGGECAGSTPVRDGLKIAASLEFKPYSDFLLSHPISFWLLVLKLKKENNQLEKELDLNNKFKIV